MNIAESKSFNDGIEFYEHKKNISIRLRRNADGEIIITRKNSIDNFEKIKDSPLSILIIFVLSAILAFIYNCLEDYKVKMLVTIVYIWICTYGYFFINSKKTKNQMLFKYHAAEHKALNYLDRYEAATQDCNKIMKMPSISFRCGSTLIAFMYILVSLVSVGLLFIPNIFLKILWCISSLILTVFLWIKGKCNFFQKFVIKEPDYEQVELAMIGLEEYMKIKE